MSAQPWKRDQGVPYRDEDHLDQLAREGTPTRRTDDMTTITQQKKMQDLQWATKWRDDALGDGHKWILDAAERLEQAAQEMRRYAERYDDAALECTGRKPATNNLRVTPQDVLSWALLALSNVNTNLNVSGVVHVTTAITSTMIDWSQKSGIKQGD